MKKDKNPKRPGKCQCFTRFDAKQGAYVQCSDHTSRKFAPGHDARLKGLLIRLHIADSEYVRLVDSQLITTEPLAVAKEFGWDGYLHAAKERAVRFEQLKAARAAARQAATQERLEAKQAKQAAKASKPQAAKPQAGFHPVRVKIGRWEYDATVESEGVNSLTVSYLDKKGNRKTEEVKRSQVVN